MVEEQGTNCELGMVTMRTDVLAACSVAVVILQKDEGVGRLAEGKLTHQLSMRAS